MVTAVGTISSFYINGSFIGGQSLVGSIMDNTNRDILLGQLFPCKLLACPFVRSFVRGRGRERGERACVYICMGCHGRGEGDEKQGQKVLILTTSFSAVSSFSGQMQEVYFYNQALTVR